MNELKNLSIVVPVGPNENLVERLLESFPSDIALGELILVGSGQVSGRAKPEQFDSFKYLNVGLGRANQINAGVKEARSPFIWVLHADSVIDRKNLFEINYQLPRLGSQLGFFKLQFIDTEGMNLKPQELGVCFRSQTLGMPFGDQGFLFSKQKALALNLFSTEVPYGEDHDFVWRWKLDGNRLLSLQGYLKTSARKYKKGAFRLTLKYLYLSFKQAWPYFIRSA